MFRCDESNRSGGTERMEIGGCQCLKIQFCERREKFKTGPVEESNIRADYD